ncbi:MULTISPECIES: hypothetical protein [unclassified Myxococcus]|uniref:hypothetical protein n=1 Tax=unclassified Myxococcus TaxID=2648731 RepID=UPI00157B96A2|nr:MULTISPECIES: hypothetical protein [unclassified Myxococcus]NTX06025.1 hypothetical protein [Myxococcus sp. CA040A]NTX51284.1 hypothetical protein [Myxococcus sp. CA039A]
MNARRIRSFVLASLSGMALLACGVGAPEVEPVSPETTDSEASTQAQRSCADECYQANFWCEVQCQATSEQCAAAISICYDSCNRGVGPWLPC